MHFVDGLFFYYFFLELFIFGNLSGSEMGKISVVDMAWFIPTHRLAELIYFKLQPCVVVLGGL